MNTNDREQQPAGDGGRWPFVESPGEFTERLREAMQHFPLIGAVRHVLIENPPMLTAAGRGGEGDWVLVPKSAMAWLNGECGTEFECPPDLYFRGKPAPYWWRVEFDRRIAAAAPQQPPPVGVTDAMVEAARAAYYEAKQFTHTGMVLNPKECMRAALEAAFVSFQQQDTPEQEGRS